MNLLPTTRTASVVAALLCSFAVLPHAQAQPKPAATATPTADVVFICEHGSAKSMIAAEHFNRIAQRRGLSLRAISRGVTPDSELQAATARGLQVDGIATQALVPALITPEVAAQVRKIVTIGLEQEPAFLQRMPRVQWEHVPAVSQDYAKSRDDMVRRINALLDEWGTTAGISATAH